MDAAMARRNPRDKRVRRASGQASRFGNVECPGP
jgi:hypothetical protein